MDEKMAGCVKETSSRGIEQGFENVSRAIDSLCDVVTEIDSGNMPKPHGEEPEVPSRSISELVKETPKILVEIAEKIRDQSNRLRDLLL